ncbi:MAG: hypothetical protein GY716_04175 [bacterium]|nr:hypothetical protein [bacterium]
MRQANPIRRSGESSYWELFRLDCAALSAAGAGRANNEDDCVFAAPGEADVEAARAGYLFAVIDGVSQGGNGGRAARETATSMLEILDDPRREELRPDLLLHQLQAANDRCDGFIRGRCVATALWLWEDHPAGSLVAAWAHVGDTRLYHHGSRGWKLLTKDHSRGGLLDRAVGQGPGLIVDTGTRTLRAGETLVLASDGVYKFAPPQSVLPREPFPSTAESVRRLVGNARLNGSRDDTSAIAIAVGRADADAEPEH